MAMMLRSGWAVYVWGFVLGFFLVFARVILDKCLTPLMLACVSFRSSFGFFLVIFVCATIHLTSVGCLRFAFKILVGRSLLI